MASISPKGFGYGSKLNQGTAGFGQSRAIHLPGQSRLLVSTYQGNPFGVPIFDPQPFSLHPDAGAHVPQGSSTQLLLAYQPRAEEDQRFLREDRDVLPAPDKSTNSPYSVAQSESTFWFLLFGLVLVMAPKG